MPRKLKKADSAAHDNQVALKVKDSANQIWLAGLGAFAKTQESGSKLFDSLVKEGEAAQERTRKAAEETVEEAKSKVVEMRKRASGRWDRLEKVFEDRVARALNRLGVPAAEDIQELSKRVDELNANIAELTEEKKSGARRRLSKEENAAA